ncbi:Predicted arabinose efflux permease, MFS family [Ligilactobacillus sp. WC1T17]|uniref:Predicted arabinose efflux permease, MFS family n=1 Tax=Ligilactobacillus ruminis TaxID=1623 RepID=A0ABY1A903_9LACO|nr:Predicted arabinose efflux permease, MFS family [Ligilactobacillus ruminis]
MKRILLYNSLSNIMLEVVVWMIYLKAQGWSVAQIAFLEGTFTICQALFEVPSGIISDWIGHKRALVLGEVLCALYLLTYFMPKQHLVLFAGFVIFAVGLALISGTDVSLLYENIPETQKKAYLKYAGLFNGCITLAVALGNFSGGWLAKISWNVLFISAIIVRLAALLTCLSISEQKMTDEDDPITFKLLFSELKDFTLHERAFWPVTFATCFASGAITISYQYGTLLLEQLKMPTEMISTVFGIISLLGAVSVLSYKFIQYWSDKSLIIFLQALAVVCSILLAFRNVFWLLLGLIVMNAVFEIWNVLLENRIQTISYGHIRATVFSVVNIFESGLMTLGSILIGLLTKQLSLNTTVALLCVTLLGVAVLCSLKLEKTKLV